MFLSRASGRTPWTAAWAAIPDSKKSATDIADWTFAQKAAKAIDDQGFKP